MSTRHGTVGWNLPARMITIVLGLAVMLGAPTLSSCADGSSLTRAKAEALIRAKLGLTKGSPKYEITGGLRLFFEGFCDGRQMRKDTRANVEVCGPDSLSAGTNSLISQGLVTVAFDGDTSHLSLTPNGQQYAAGNPVKKMSYGSEILDQTVYISTAEFGTITGINVVPQYNTATVEWTLIKKPAPFANHANQGSGDYRAPISSVQSGAVQMTTTFTKYDDGWRISQ